MSKWFAQPSLPVGQYQVKRIFANHSTVDINESEYIDQLAEEVPVSLIYNGVSHAVMLATPQDLEDFALGFSITEGILQDKSELYSVDIKQQENGIELHLDISTQQFMQLKQKRRSMTGRTGCGLCGAESLQQVFHLPVLRDLNDDNKHPIKKSSIFKARLNIQAMQTLQQLTGATHACAWADEHGDVHYVREDVGRHNALDKLLGVLIANQVYGGFIITTSRSSYEMVQKVAMTGFDLLAAISAPTGLAVRIAEAYGITLLGFLKESQCVAYSHRNKII